jgi:MoaA/NifB/PqqE/SkfB family radical SAM enzyme
MSKRFGSHLYLNTVIRKDNIGEIDAIHDLSRELKCMVAFYGLEVAAEDDELNLRAYDPDLKPTDDVRKQLVEAFEHIKALKKKKSISLFQSDKLLDGFRDFFKDPNANMRWKCSAGALYLEVLPEGTISVCNATPTIPGYDYRNLPELYAREDREDIFNRYRTTCSGCICTRQVEDAARNPGDLIEKAKVYMKTLFG